MMCRSIAAGVLVLFGLSLTAQAQTYTIRIKEFPDVGKKTSETTSEKSNGSIKISFNGMVVKDEAVNENVVKEFTLETLEKGDGPLPKKFKKTFTKAVVVKGNKDEAEPYQGRAVIYELKDNSYDARAEGDPALPEAAVKKLQEQANQAGKTTRVMLPNKAVAVGDTWTIDAGKLAEAISKTLPLDVAKSSAQGKLVKVYQKDNHQFGVLEFDIKLALSGFGPAKLTTPIPLTSKMTIDVAIDGSSTQATMRSTGSMQGKSEIMMNGQTIQVDFNVELGGGGTTTAEK